MHLERPITPKPFLKWAGGKSQLLERMIKFLPPQMQTGQITRYIEPFVGGGAMFFHVASNYPVKEFFILDINEDLVLTYKTIQKNVKALIDLLAKTEKKYGSLDSEERRDFYYKVRTRFNANRSKIDFKHDQPKWIERAAQIIFLNRTCYNGLFRVNSKGAFNVPFGNYKNPTICDSSNLTVVSRVLQNAEIECADFAHCQKHAGSDTFVYFDPPYRPISKTSSFTSYSRYVFDDKTQKRLADFYRLLDSLGAKLMLSNSDPKNKNPEDHFFERLYSGFCIQRVTATRMINCDASKRGPLTELVITNY